MTYRWITGGFLALSIGVTGCGRAAAPMVPPPTALASAAEQPARPTYHTQSLLGDIFKAVKKTAKAAVNVVTNAPETASKILDKGSGAWGSVVGSAVGVVAGKQAGRAVGKVIGHSVGSVAGDLVGIGAISKAVKAAKALAKGDAAGAISAVGSEATDALAAAKAAHALIKGDAEAAVDAVSAISPKVAKAMQAAKVAKAMANPDTADVLNAANLDPSLTKAVSAAKVAAQMGGVNTDEVTNPDLAAAINAKKAADAVATGRQTANVDPEVMAAAQVSHALASNDIVGALSAAAKMDPKVAMALLTALAAREQLKTQGTDQASAPAAATATSQPTADAQANPTQPGD